MRKPQPPRPPTLPPAPGWYRIGAYTPDGSLSAYSAGDHHTPGTWTACMDDAMQVVGDCGPFTSIWQYGAPPPATEHTP